MAEAKVTRLPPVRLLKPMVAVSPISTETLLWSMPSSSAATLAIEAREPPMSGWPVVTTTLPSSVMLTCALLSPPALNQKPRGDAAAALQPGRGFLSSGAL